MNWNIIATNANLKTTTVPGTTIWARDAAGNEVELTLNERLTKRVIGAQVDAALTEILASLTPVSDQLRETTDKAEEMLREVHNTLFSTLRSEIGIRKARNLEETAGPSSGDLVIA